MPSAEKASSLAHLGTALVSVIAVWNLPESALGLGVFIAASAVFANSNESTVSIQCLTASASFLRSVNDTSSS
jgi:hypothetical protein